MMATEKFKALVHFIIEECADPARLGAVRLNKICWYADVGSYKTTGRPITGEAYVKRQMGPVPKNILHAIRELEQEGAIAVSEREFGTYRRRDFMSLREVNKDDLLSAEEQAIVRELMHAICDGHTAATISDLWHDQIWDAASMGEEIPLYATLASKAAEVTDDIIGWADRMVADIMEAKRAA